MAKKIVHFNGCFIEHDFYANEVFVFMDHLTFPLHDVGAKVSMPGHTLQTAARRVILGSSTNFHTLSQRPPSAGQVASFDKTTICGSSTRRAERRESSSRKARLQPNQFYDLHETFKAKLEISLGSVQTMAEDLLYDGRWHAIFL